MDKKSYCSQRAKYISETYNCSMISAIEIAKKEYEESPIMVYLVKNKKGLE